MNQMKCRVLAILIIFGLASPMVAPSKAEAEPMRDFIMSCSYGVLAGTLVGAATLAFSDKPGDNLNKIARGASFGLYAGILLGTYVLYGVPDGATEDEVRALGQASASQPRKLQDVRLVLNPLFSPTSGGARGESVGELAGLEIRYAVLRF